MNYIDYMLILILLIGAGYGAAKGPVRQLTGLVSIWLGLIVSLWLYKPFSARILGGVFKSASPLVLDSFSFIVLLIIFTAIAQGVFIFTTKAPEEKRKKGKKDLNEMLDKVDKGLNFSILNALGGMVIGFFVTAVWLSIFLAIIRYFLSAGGVGSGAFSVQLSHAALLPWFSLLLNWVYISIKLFIPKQLPAIFTALL